MTSWEQYVAQQERDELDRFGHKLTVALKQKLEQYAGSGSCFWVTFSRKDADLDTSGCFGIGSVTKVTEDEITVEFVQHWTSQYCERCGTSHRLHEWADECGETEDSEYEDYCEERREAVQFEIPAAVQEDPSGSIILNTFAMHIRDTCWCWAEQAERGCEICGGHHTGWCPDPEVEAEREREQQEELEAGQYYDLHND